MAPVDWENLCRRCGECCFEKWVEEDGTIFYTGVACRYLDVVSRECKVYHKRFDVGEECTLLTPEVVQRVQWLPSTCGYVRHLQGTTSEEVPKDRKRRKKRHCEKFDRA